MEKMSVLKLKIIGLVGTAFLTLAWSGIISNFILCVVFGVLGASSLTIFLFLMNEGLKNTRSVTKYMLRLIIVSILAAFPYFMVYHDLKKDYADFYNYLSTPFMIFFCLGTVYVLDKWKNKTFKIISLVVLCIFAAVIRVEYAPLSLFLAYLIHEYDDRKQKRYRNFSIALYFIALSVCSVLIILLSKQSIRDQYFLVQTATMGGVVLGLPFINRYDGKITEKENPKFVPLVKYGGYAGYIIMISGFAVLKYFLRNL